MTRLVVLVFTVLLGFAPLALSGPTAAEPNRDRDPDRDRAPIVAETGRLEVPAEEARRAMTSSGQPSVVDRYIVVLKESVADPLRVARRLSGPDVVPTHVYRYALKGFAARIAPGRLAALKRDPDVVSVEPDRVVSGAAQTQSTGVRRVGAPLNDFADIDGKDLPRVDVDIAVIDSGVGPHPDLNIRLLANCISGSTNFNDENGHGTHVAGIAAALDNGVGVVGVAPGARIWSVKVLDADLKGTESSVMCGVDFVRQHAPGTGLPGGDIEVANASYAGGDTALNSDCANPMHQVYCDAVAAGVTFVAAAGNGGVDANRTTPATYDEVITVSNLVDSDGKRGGKGPAIRGMPDDAIERMSNFGADIDLAAPGTNILSTVPGGGFQKLTGTSMAAPHVAGAAALYIAQKGNVGPAAVKAGLLAQKEAWHMNGDRDSFDEGVVNVEMPDTTPPTVAITAPKAGAILKAGPTITLKATDKRSGVKSVAVRFCPGTSCDFAAGKPIGAADTNAPYGVKWAKLPKNGTYTLVAQATDKAGNIKLSAQVTVKVKR